MEYFTKQLWQQLNSDRAAERAAAQRQWEEHWQKYQTYLASLAPHLSAALQQFLLQCGDFHDAVFSEISFLQGDSGRLCKIVLSLASGKAELRFQDVQKLDLSLESFQAAVAGQLSWGYCELKRIARHRFRISIICDMQNEIMVEFGRLQFRMLP